MKHIRSTEEATRIIERFESLPLEKRLDAFRELSAEARELLMGTISKPGEIVRRISEEEMFLTIKQLGEENAPSLIAATTGKQLLYLLDVDLWSKDMFNAQAAQRWMNIIAGISADKILHFVQVVDPELLVTALHSLMRVQTRNPDIDLLEEMDYLPPFTLDDIFFVEFLVPDVEDSAKAFIERIYVWNLEYYTGLMQELSYGVSAENEEMAGKWRRARLADHGFPEFDEAVEIYHYLPPSAISVVRDRYAPSHDDELAAVMPVVDYPLKLIESETMFMKCLRKIEDPVKRDRLSVELAHLANKVIIADGREAGAVEEIIGALKKVSGHINIALEEMSGDGIGQAMELLESNHMEILFRRGFSLILDLRKEAHKLVRMHEGGLENLGYPLAELIKGLIQKRPYYAANVLGERKSREFQFMEDLHVIRNLMDRAYADDSWEPI